MIEQFTTSQHPTVNLDRTLADYNLPSPVGIIRADFIQNTWSRPLLTQYLFSLLTVDTGAIDPS